MSQAERQSCWQDQDSTRYPRIVAEIDQRLDWPEREALETSTRERKTRLMVHVASNVGTLAWSRNDSPTGTHVCGRVCIPQCS